MRKLIPFAVLAILLVVAGVALAGSARTSTPTGRR